MEYVNRHRKELKLIPGYRHDILHDSCGREVWEYIREWMERGEGHTKILQ